MASDDEERITERHQLWNAPDLTVHYAALVCSLFCSGFCAILELIVYI
jgi:hypothetical protein